MQIWGCAVLSITTNCSKVQSLSHILQEVVLLNSINIWSDMDHPRSQWGLPRLREQSQEVLGHPGEGGSRGYPVAQRIELIHAKAMRRVTTGNLGNLCTLIEAIIATIKHTENGLHLWPVLRWWAAVEASCCTDHMPLTDVLSCS
jgi:hypothetical protein